MSAFGKIFPKRLIHHGLVAGAGAFCARPESVEHGAVDRALTLETGSSDREANMRAFALKTLETMLAVLEAAPKV